MFLMEGVEDVPRAAMAAGIPWGWESFPEYYQFLGSTPLGLNVGAHVGHCALRIHAMGERGATDERAGPEDLAAMQAALRDAMAAGALGVSTSRTTGHKTAGDAVPGTFADPSELHALAAVLAECNALRVRAGAPFGAVGEAAGGSSASSNGWRPWRARAAGGHVRAGAEPEPSRRLARRAGRGRGGPRAAPTSSRK
jgi:hypothetical protein